MRGENGELMVEPAAATVVVQGFKRRDRGGSLVEIQALLAENGIERALSGVAWMLRSRMYLGEIHFGELHNPRAHAAIVRIAPCSSGCSGGRSRAGAKPSPSGCWPVWECCAAGHAGRGW